MDYFISIYFNPFNYKSRYRLTKEFCQRYPWIHLVEGYYDEPEINHSNTTLLKKKFKGFLKEELINDFISMNRDNIRSLTIIDSDLLLFDNFREKVIEKINDTENEPYFIQSFSECEDIRIGSLVPDRQLSCVKYNKDKGVFGGHTGYIHTFNKKALDIIVEFPEFMVLGGFDTILLYSLMKQRDRLLNLINNKTFKEILNYFYETIKLIKCDYVSGKIYHYFHGFRADRYKNMFKKYGELPEYDYINYIKEVQIFMSNRNEDININ